MNTNRNCDRFMIYTNIKSCCTSETNIGQYIKEFLMNKTLFIHEKYILLIQVKILSKNAFIYFETTNGRGEKMQNW